MIVAFPSGQWINSLRPGNAYMRQQTIIGSDNGLLSSWCQAIIWINAGILLIGPLGTNFSEIFIEIIIFSLKKMYLKMFAKWQQFYLSLNELILLFFNIFSLFTHLTPYFLCIGQHLSWRHHINSAASQTSHGGLMELATPEKCNKMMILTHWPLGDADVILN